MPTKSPIYIGDFVIINETDAPQTKLIARVVEVDSVNDRIKADYICEATNMVRCIGRLSEATLVADFGVELQFEGDRVTAIQTRPSSAFYNSDGVTREWQPGSPNPTQKLRKSTANKADKTRRIYAN